VTLWYWPWIMLRATTVSTFASTLILALLVFAQGLSSAYIAVGVAVPLLVLAALRLARSATRGIGWRLVAAVGIAAAGWAIAFAPQLRMWLEQPKLAQQTLYPFFSRVAAPSELFASGEPSGIAPVALALIVLGGLAAAVGSGRHRTAWRSGVVWVVVGLALALPPRVLVFGHAILTPIGWLTDVGIPVHAVRDNGRRGLAALVGLCVLVGVAWAECEAWLTRRPWRHLIAMLVVVGIVGYAAGRPMGPNGMPTFGAAADLGIELLALGLYTPFALLAARWVQGRPAGTVASVTGRLRLGWLGRCLLIALPAVVLMLGLDGALLIATGDTMSGDRGSWVGTGDFLAAAAMLLVLVPLQTAAEEYVFRGWLLQAAGTFARRPWLAIVVQAPLFALAHGLGTPWGFADLVVFAVVLGWLAVRTGGIEAGIALHLVNNLVVMVLGAAFGGLADSGSAADAPLPAFLVATGINVGYAALIAWLARRRRVAVTVPEASTLVSFDPPRG
jgi:membrane protease YdiL (CAAX protease family)